LAPDSLGELKALPRPLAGLKGRFATGAEWKEALEGLGRGRGKGSRKGEWGREGNGEVGE